MPKKRGIFNTVPNKPKRASAVVATILLRSFEFGMDSREINTHSPVLWCYS